MIDPEPDVPVPGEGDEENGAESDALTKYVSDKGGERAEKWWARLEAANVPWEDGETERSMYRDAEWGIFPRVIAGGSNDPIDLLMVGGDAAGPQQVVLNVVGRVIRRAKGKAFDKSVLLKFPRRVKGVEHLAEGVEQMLTRVSERARLMQEFRDGISNIYTDGGFGLFVGMPWVPMREDVEAAGKGAEEIVEEVVAGEHTPNRLQDHRGVAGALLNIYGDPEISTNAAPEDLDALAESAQAHADMEDAEAAGVVRFDKASLEMERLTLGDQLRRDMSSPHKRHWRWMARQVLMSRREAYGLGSLRDEWVARLPAYRWERDEDGRRHRIEVKDIEEDPDTLVCFWEVYDRWYLARHIVAEGVEGYGETNEAYPYWKRDGSGPSIRGFFPFVVCAPNTTAEGEPIPGCRAFWHQQIELIKTDSAILAVVKRAALDIYGCDSDKFQQIEKALREGVGGKVLPFAPGTDISKAFAALNMQGPIVELIQERQQKLLDLSIAAQVSLTELTGQQQTDTAAQEQMVMQAGQAGVSDEVQQAAVAYGEALDIAWDLIREHWSVEDVNAEMGGDYADVWDQWVSSPLSDEKITAEFSPASIEDNPEKAQTIMSFMQQVAAIPSQEFPGQPAFDLVKMANMASKAIGLGELPPFQPTPEMLMAMQAGTPPPGGAPQEPDPSSSEPPPYDRAARGRRRGKGGRAGPGQPAKPPATAAA